MAIYQSVIETQKRISIIKQIDNHVKNSSLSGLLVTGSLAWGKNEAVISTSDIDFYLLAPSVESFRTSLRNMPVIPIKTVATFLKLLNYRSKQTDTRSMKTNVGSYPGAIYLFIENDLKHLLEKFGNLHSTFFKNLRPHDIPQTKEYKSLKGKMITFTTPISKANQNDNFWIRTDPLYLIDSEEFYGSIFLSHLMFGEIYTDKFNTIRSAQTKARHFLKSLLPKEKARAFVHFQNYLPHIERMNDKIIKNLFDSVWSS